MEALEFYCSWVFSVHAYSLTRARSCYEYLGIKFKDNSIASLSSHCSHLSMAAILCLLPHIFFTFCGQWGFIKSQESVLLQVRATCIWHMLLFFSGSQGLTSPYFPPNSIHTLLCATLVLQVVRFQLFSEHLWSMYGGLTPLLFVLLCSRPYALTPILLFGPQSNPLDGSQYFNIIDEEAVAQRGEVTCPQSRSHVFSETLPLRYKSRQTSVVSCWLLLAVDWFHLIQHTATLNVAQNLSRRTFGQKGIAEDGVRYASWKCP